MQRSAIVSALDFLVGGFGFGQGDFRRKPRVGIELRTDFFRAIKVGLGEIHRRERFGLNALGEFASGEVEDFVAEHGHVWSSRASGFVRLGWFRRRRWLRCSRWSR